MTVRTVDNVWIPLADGTRLAARLWLPAGGDIAPVPAILEYLPYRKDDGTAEQDETRHPFFAKHGYAAVRVDIRGTGDSDGILYDEYLTAEQDDALEVIDWIAEQPWCSGEVGMIGYSWGGFNGLQVAARRPEQLKAIVTVYSTDDRYADDCHYMGGCLLGSDMLKWASSMRVYNALPPDPRFRDDWREAWIDRLSRTPPFIEPWLSHQTRGEFWRQGSVIEDYSAIRAATLVVGGWADAYTNSVPRLLQHLTCERRGIIGPWAHVMPYGGIPGPAIGFLTECVRWFDRWLKGIDTGVEDTPLLTAWIEEPAPPADYYAERPGTWVAVDEWPPRQAKPKRLWLAEGERLASGECARGEVAVAVASPPHTGGTAGVWCANGLPHELAVDQRPDDALSVCFDSELLEEEMVVLGVPVVRLAVTSDRPLALVAVRLCEVAKDGASTLVSWGMLNLTHRDGHETPVSLVPGTRYDVALDMNVIGHRFAPGSRLRLAVSQAYWPHAWPSPEPVTLSLQLDGCSLDLPVMSGALRRLAEAFEEPEYSSDEILLRPGGRTRVRESEAGTSSITDVQEFTSKLSSGTTYAGVARDSWEITDDDPLSARAEAHREEWLIRGDWCVRAVVNSALTATSTHFNVDDTLTAYEGEEVVFVDSRHFSIPRDGV